MTIDRAELFRFAWLLARKQLWVLRLPASRLRSLFPEALSEAWAELKRRAAYRAAQRKAHANARPATEVRSDIQALECKDRLSGSDWTRLDMLRGELRAANHTADGVAA